MPTYQVTHLTKRYVDPDVLANDDLSFDVRPGEAFGLLGPNGAGKTTLVRQLVGLMAPTSGEVRLFGEAVGASGNDRRIGRAVAYLPQGSMTLGELKVEEAIRWTGSLRGLSKEQALHESDELMTTLGIESIADRQIRKTSGGQKRLTQLAMTLVGHLPVLILDEPTADIDVALRQTIWTLIGKRCTDGATVILVTHDVAEAERTLDRVAILDRGRIVAGGTPAELKAKLAHRTRIEIVVAEGAATRASELAGVISGDARVRDRHISAWVPAEDAVRNLDKVMDAAEPGSLEDIRLVTPTLEDVYLEVGGRSITEADNR